MFSNILDRDNRIKPMSNNVSVSVVGSDIIGLKFNVFFDADRYLNCVKSFIFVNIILSFSAVNLAWKAF